MATTLKEREVVIVGGGLCAGLIARKLVPLGRDVLVLERGGERSGAESQLPSQRDELRWSLNRGLSQRENVETYTLRYSPDEESLPIRRLIAFLPGFGVGGAASHWNGFTWRYQPNEFSLRSHLEQRYGKAAIPDYMTIQDWKIKYDDLEPHYTLFEKLFGIAGKAGNIKGKKQAGGNPFEGWRSEEYSLPPLEQAESGLIFKETVEKLGFKPFPIPAANASRPYTNPDGMKLGACQYCGHCERFICEANAKASPHILLFPLVRGKSNFELKTHADVFRLHYDAESKRVTGVSYTDATTGEEFIQPAGVVILAGHTLSNTRLMLLSKIGQPYDPKTGKGVVGKNYCYQTLSGVNVFFKDRIINPFMGAGAGGMVIDEFNNDNFDHGKLGFVGGGFIAAAVTNGRPITARHLPPGAPLWGTKWKAANARWYLRAFTLMTHGTSYAHRNNYMDLDPDYRDAYGRPLLRITFDFPENDVKMSAHITMQAHDIGKASNATVVGTMRPRQRPFDVRVPQSSHNTGGTVMGDSKETSVVSTRLQCWDAQNLFISGASVFPQNSGYNPTGTIAALTLRLADDLISYLERPRAL